MGTLASPLLTLVIDLCRYSVQTAETVVAGVLRDIDDTGVRLVVVIDARRDYSFPEVPDGFTALELDPGNTNEVRRISDALREVRSPVSIITNAAPLFGPGFYARILSLSQATPFLEVPLAAVKAAVSDYIGWRHASVVDPPTPASSAHVMATLTMDTYVALQGLSLSCLTLRDATHQYGERVATLEYQRIALRSGDLEVVAVEHEIRAPHEVSKTYRLPPPKLIANMPNWIHAPELKGPTISVLAVSSDSTQRATLGSLALQRYRGFETIVVGDSPVSLDARERCNVVDHVPQTGSGSTGTTALGATSQSLITVVVPIDGTELAPWFLEEIVASFRSLDEAVRLRGYTLTVSNDGRWHAGDFGPFVSVAAADAELLAFPTSWLNNGRAAVKDGGDVVLAEGTKQHLSQRPAFYHPNPQHRRAIELIVDGADVKTINPGITRDALAYLRDLEDFRDVRLRHYLASKVDKMRIYDRMTDVIAVLDRTVQPVLTAAVARRVPYRNLQLIGSEGGIYEAFLPVLTEEDSKSSGVAETTLRQELRVWLSRRLDALERGVARPALLVSASRDLNYSAQYVGSDAQDSAQFVWRVLPQHVTVLQLKLFASAREAKHHAAELPSALPFAVFQGDRLTEISVWEWWSRQEGAGTRG